VIGAREHLIVHQHFHQHSDHNEVALFWITGRRPDTEPFVEPGACLYDAYVLSLFVEQTRSPSLRDPEWSGLFKHRIGEPGEWDALGNRIPWIEPQMHDREGAYNVPITPSGFRVFEVNGWPRPAVLPIDEYVALEAMVDRMRQLLSYRSIVTAITRAMRSDQTQTVIRTS